MLKRRVSTKMVILCFLIVLCSFNLHEVKAETNLLQNGDFSEGLDYWGPPFIWPVGDAPHIGVSEDVFPGNPCLFMDVPSGSAAMIYQVFYLPPTQKAILGFRVFGGRDPVDVIVCLGFHIEGGVLYFDDILDEFDPMGKRSYGGISTYKTYDITEFSNRVLALCFFATSQFTISPCLYVDDVAVAVAVGRNSIVSCSAQPVRVGFGENVTVDGAIFPSPQQQSNVTLTFVPPNGCPVVENVTSDFSGIYNFEFKPDITGIWEVNASWLGNVEYDPAVSFYSQFIVTAISGSFISRCVINGLEVDLNAPYVEVLPAEGMSGFTELETRGAGRHENAPIIAISTVEKGHWDLLAFHRGVVKDHYSTKLDPFGPKTIFTPPEMITYTSPSPTEGLYIHPFRWEFPVPVDTPNDLVGGGEPAVVAWHPTYIAPRLKPNQDNSTFYLVIIQSAQLQGRDVAFPPSHEFIGKTVDSLWDLHNEDWQRFVPGVRNETDSTEACIIAIPITVVVDPSPLMQKAQEMIDKTKQNIFAFPKLAQALETAIKWLSNATSEFGQRRFSEARRSANHALELVKDVQRNMTVVTEEYIEEANETKEELKKYWGNYTDFSGLDDLVDSALEEFRAENFAKARQVIEDLEDEVDGYSLPSSHPAYEIIAELDRNRWGFPELEGEIRQAEGNLSAAEWEFVFGNFSGARKLVDKALSIATATYFIMKDITYMEIIAANETMTDLKKHCGNHYADFSGLDDLVDSALEEFRAENFAKARQVIEDLEDEVDGYSLPSSHPAYEIIAELDRNRWGFPELDREIRQAEGNLSMAETEFMLRNYSKAKEFADQADDVANDVLVIMRNMTEKAIEGAENSISSLEENFGNYTDISYLKDLTDRAWDEFRADNFAEAKQTIERLKETVSGYLFPTRHPVYLIVGMLRRDRAEFPEFESEIEQVEGNLTLAEIAFAAGNFSEASKIAAQCYAMANGTTAQIQNVTLCMLNTVKQDRADLDDSWFGRRWFGLWHFVDFTYLDSLINGTQTELEAGEHAIAREMINDFYDRNIRLWTAMTIWGVLFWSGCFAAVSFVIFFLKETSRIGKKARTYILRVLLVVSTGSVLNLVFQTVQWRVSLVTLTILPYFAILIFVIFPAAFLEWQKSRPRPEEHKG